MSQNNQYLNPFQNSKIRVSASDDLLVLLHSSKIYLFHINIGVLLGYIQTNEVPAANELLQPHFVSGDVVTADVCTFAQYPFLALIGDGTHNVDTSLRYIRLYDYYFGTQTARFKYNQHVLAVHNVDDVVLSILQNKIIIHVLAAPGISKGTANSGQNTPGFGPTSATAPQLNPPPPNPSTQLRTIHTPLNPTAAFAVHSVSAHKHLLNFLTELTSSLHNLVPASINTILTTTDYQFTSNLPLSCISNNFLVAPQPPPSNSTPTTSHSPNTALTTPSYTDQTTQGYQGYAGIIDLHTNQLLQVFPVCKGPIKFMRLSPDGRLLAIASDKGTLIRVYSTMNGALLHQFRRGHNSVEICAMSFSFYNEVLAVASKHSKVVHIFKLAKDTFYDDKINILPSLLGTGTDEFVNIEDDYDQVTKLEIDDFPQGEIEEFPSTLHTDRQSASALVSSQTNTLSTSTTSTTSTSSQPQPIAVTQQQQQQQQQQQGSGWMRYFTWQNLASATTTAANYATSVISQGSTLISTAMSMVEPPRHYGYAIVNHSNQINSNDGLNRQPRRNSNGQTPQSSTQDNTNHARNDLNNNNNNGVMGNIYGSLSSSLQHLSGYGANSNKSDIYINDLRIYCIYSTDLSQHQTIKPGESAYGASHATADHSLQIAQTLGVVGYFLLVFCTDGSVYIYRGGKGALKLLKEENCLSIQDQQLHSQPDDQNNNVGTNNNAVAVNSNPQTDLTANLNINQPQSGQSGNTDITASNPTGSSQFPLNNLSGGNNQHNHGQNGNYSQNTINSNNSAISHPTRSPPNGPGLSQHAMQSTPQQTIDVSTPMLTGIDRPQHGAKLPVQHHRPLSQTVMSQMQSTSSRNNNVQHNGNHNSNYHNNSLQTPHQQQYPNQNSTPSSRNPQSSQYNNNNNNNNTTNNISPNTTPNIPMSINTSQTTILSLNDFSTAFTPSQNISQNGTPIPVIPLVGSASPLNLALPAPTTSQNEINHLPMLQQPQTTYSASQSNKNNNNNNNNFDHTWQSDEQHGSQSAGFYANNTHNGQSNHLLHNTDHNSQISFQPSQLNSNPSQASFNSTTPSRLSQELNNNNNNNNNNNAQFTPGNFTSQLSNHGTSSSSSSQHSQHSSQTNLTQVKVSPTPSRTIFNELQTRNYQQQSSTQNGQNGGQSGYSVQNSTHQSPSPPQSHHQQLQQLQQQQSNQISPISPTNANGSRTDPALLHKVNSLSSQTNSATSSALTALSKTQATEGLVSHLFNSSALDFTSDPIMSTDDAVRIITKVQTQQGQKQPNQTTQQSSHNATHLSSTPSAYSSTPSNASQRSQQQPQQPSSKSTPQVPTTSNASASNNTDSNNVVNNTSAPTPQFPSEIVSPSDTSSIPPPPPPPFPQSSHKPQQDSAPASATTSTTSTSAQPSPLSQKNSFNSTTPSSARNLTGTPVENSPQSTFTATPYSTDLSVQSQSLPTTNEITSLQNYVAHSSQNSQFNSENADAKSTDNNLEKDNKSEIHGHSHAHRAFSTHHASQIGKGHNIQHTEQQRFFSSTGLETLSHGDFDAASQSHISQPDLYPHASKSSKTSPQKQQALDDSGLGKADPTSNYLQSDRIDSSVPFSSNGDAISQGSGSASAFHSLPETPPSSHGQIHSVTDLDGDFASRDERDGDGSKKGSHFRQKAESHVVFNIDTSAAHDLYQKQQQDIKNSNNGTPVNAGDATPNDSPSHDEKHNVDDLDLTGRRLSLSIAGSSSPTLPPNDKKVSQDDTASVKTTHSSHSQKSSSSGKSGKKGKKGRR